MKAAAYPHQMVGVPKTTEGTPHLRSSGYGGPPKGGSPKFRDTRGLAGRAGGSGGGGERGGGGGHDMIT